MSVLFTSVSKPTEMWHFYLDQFVKVTSNPQGMKIYISVVLQEVHDERIFSLLQLERKRSQLTGWAMKTFVLYFKKWTTDNVRLGWTLFNIIGLKSQNILCLKRAVIIRCICWDKEIKTEPNCSLKWQKCHWFHASLELRRSRARVGDRTWKRRQRLTGEKHFLFRHFSITSEVQDFYVLYLKNVFKSSLYRLGK